MVSCYNVPMSTTIILLIALAAIILAFFQGYSYGKDWIIKHSDEITDTGFNQALKTLEQARDKHLEELINTGAELGKEQAFARLLALEYATRNILQLPEWKGSPKEAEKIASKLLDELADEIRPEFERQYPKIARQMIKKEVDNIK